MKVSKVGLDLIRLFEELAQIAYPDPITKGKPYTIGYGTTVYPDGRSVALGDVCTKEQAEEYLMHDCARFENAVNKAVIAPINQNQFDALVSIVYNVGEGSKYKSGIIRLKNGSPSTLLRKLNAGDYVGCADEFLKWISKGTAAERGLNRRRQAERKLFLS